MGRKKVKKKKRAKGGRGRERERERPRERDLYESIVQNRETEKESKIIHSNRK